MSVRHGLFLIAVLTAVFADKPALEIQPKQTTVTKPVGQSLALTCKPINNQDPKLITQLEWRDQNDRKIDTKTAPVYVQPLSTEVGAILIFQKLTQTQAGNYKCTARYSNAETLEANVRVATIIDITWKDAPEFQYPVLGKDFRVRCEVEADPAPEVDWMKNNQPIVTSDRYVINAGKGLLIKNVTESDDGVYTCRAVVVDTGNIKERNIKVEVQIPPVLEKIKEISIVEGEQASVECKGIGKPPPEYRWIKENTREDLSEKDRFDVKKNTGLLLINKAEYNDNSMYKCIAENAAGLAETTVKINVLVKPEIFEFINVTIPVNQKTKIICKAKGRPTPDITFRKLSLHDAYTLGPQRQNTRIIVEEKFDSAKGEKIAVLSIENVNRTDDGLYECVAKNKVGAAYKNGHITVQFPPTFEKTKDYPPVWTWDNRPGNLSCIAESIPNATIKWRFRGIDLLEGPNVEIKGHGPQSNLIIQPFNDRKFFAGFECIAINPLGQTSRIIELRQATVPGPVLQVNTADLTATTVKFNIQGPPNLHGLPLRAFIVQYQTERQRTWDTAMNKTWSVSSPYIVENLIPQETYNFRFAAKNDVGIGGYGENKQITMPRRSVPAEPKILISNFGENATRDTVAISPYADHFELRWNVPNDNGDPIDSYFIRYCVSHRVNGEWRDSDSECSTQITLSVKSNSYELNQLQADTTYKIELRAHNAIGSSLPAQIRVKTARGLDTMIYNHEGPKITSAMIIGIVVAAVVVILILVDVTCFCVNRAGVIALMCGRAKPIDDEDPKLGSYKAAPAHPNSLNLPLPVKLAPVPVEEKEPLSPENQDHSAVHPEKRNISVEFDGKQVYSKTGAEIGRHSAV